MPPEPLQIRIATAADSDRLIPLINEAFSVETFMTGPRTDPERLAASMQKGAILLAEDHLGQLVASIYVEVRGERGYAGMLAVSPAKQRLGIGSRMMKAAEDYLRTHGCVALDITVLSLRTELPPVYRAYGFVETGAVPFEYPHPLKDGLETHCIVMSKPL
ncbi:GNAT family N-acetyltransferase [Occallatibacter riparius]|uniref:GNAT family N-acetyltransferase n=1 Tax=Occallatibacter riparius TaxID=1002689 RepID=A0A9J7BTP1_9BACT|nr:GNAT family N-acetyltransferase [Occallatibacter riparius]UWZ86244.1 GNAT family N-acetyltransferase [Occallatibacter riparius]